jgi:S-DNA-T family DNA segregation ATPase FtsK/SpoIIIE
VSTVFDDRLVLRMSDPNDYNYAGVNERNVPSDMPPGRVLEAVGAAGASLRESQIALLDADPAGTAQVAALQRLAREAERSYNRPSRNLRPLHVDELPIRISYSEALALDPDFEAPSALWALIGAGGDELEPVGVDLLAEGPGFTVAGPPRSGRSTVLFTMVRSLLDPDLGEGTVPVVLICPRRSPLRTLEGEPGVLAVLDAHSDEDALDQAVGENSRYVIVVDDAELMDGTDLEEPLEEALRSARDGDHGLIIAGTNDELARTYNGFIADCRRSRSGALLGVNSSDDGELLGLRLPRNVSTVGPAGRILLVRLGRSIPAQGAFSQAPIGLVRKDL